MSDPVYANFVNGTTEYYIYPDSTAAHLGAGIVLYSVSGGIPVRDNNLSDVVFNKYSAAYPGVIGEDTSSLGWDIFDSRQAGISNFINLLEQKVNDETYITQYGPNFSIGVITAHVFTDAGAVANAILAYYNKSSEEGPANTDNEQNSTRSPTAYQAAVLNSYSFSKILSNPALLSMIEHAIVHEEGGDNSANYTFDPGDGISLTFSAKNVYVDDSLASEEGFTEIAIGGPLSVNDTVGFNGYHSVAYTTPVRQLLFSENGQSKTAIFDSDLVTIDFYLGTIDTDTFFNLGGGSTLIAGASLNTISISGDGKLHYSINDSVDQIDLPADFVPVPKIAQEILTGVMGTSDLVVINANNATYSAATSNQIVVAAGEGDTFDAGGVSATLIDLDSAGGTLSLTTAPAGVTTVELYKTANNNGNSEVDVVVGSNTIQTYNITTIVGGNGLNTLDLSNEELAFGTVHFVFVTGVNGVTTITDSNGLTICVEGFTTVDLGAGAKEISISGAGSQNATAGSGSGLGDFGFLGATALVDFNVGDGDSDVASSMNNLSINFGDGVDTLSQAAAGSAVTFATDSTNIVNAALNDVLLAGETAADELVYFGQKLTGALRWLDSDSPYAVGKFGVKYAMNQEGDLVVTTPSGNTEYIANYVGGPGAVTQDFDVFVANYTTSASVASVGWVSEA